MARNPLAKTIEQAMANLQESLDIIVVLRKEDPVFGEERIKMASATLTLESLELMQSISGQELKARRG